MFPAKLSVILKFNVGKETCTYNLSRENLAKINRHPTQSYYCKNSRTLMVFLKICGLFFNCLFFFPEIKSYYRGKQTKEEWNIFKSIFKRF